jgi:endonuclease/exonuclease/phosphatase family metal-dependent hydrolase
MTRKKGGKKPGLLKGLLLFLNIVVVMITLAAFAANFISPEKVWQLAFAGLSYPFLVAVNLLFLFFWLLWRPKFAMLSGIILLVGFPISARHFQMNYPDEFNRNDSTIIHVASLNVGIFDIWATYGKPQYETFDRVISYFGYQQPDILCLQESIIQHQRTGNIAGKLKTSLGFKGMHAAPYYGNGSSGMVTLFNGKMVGEGQVTHQDRIIAIYTDIELPGRTIRVYNVHLQSIKLGREEYVMDNLASEAYNDTLLIKGTRQIAKKLKYAFMLRAAQADLLHAHIKGSGLPVVVCGDLNDTPGSYAYTRTKKGLKDAFRVAGKGMGRTYHGKFPSFRIDYILSSKSIEVLNFTTSGDRLSDHTPISAYLRVTTDAITP